LDFNSTDAVGNIEATNTVTIILEYGVGDTTKPTITLIQPLNETISASKVIIFDLNDNIGIAIATVDINGVASTAFNLASCLTFDTNRHCSYTETLIDANGSYLIEINATDTNSNAADQNTSIYEYTGETSTPPPEEGMFSITVCSFISLMILIIVGFVFVGILRNFALDLDLIPLTLLVLLIIIVLIIISGFIPVMCA
jgi:hypothetical protein